MTDRDDRIAEAILSGDPTEKADLMTRRVFPLSLAGKVRVCVATLAVAATLAPALYLRRGLIRSLERVETLREVLTPAISVAVAVGVVVTFGFGLTFVVHGWRLADGSLSVERAQRLIRIEDLLMTLVTANGLLFVLAPVALAWVGVVSPGAVESLYESGIEVYTPITHRLDARFTSGGGALGAAVLWLLWRLDTPPHRGGGVRGGESGRGDGGGDGGGGDGRSGGT